MATLNIRLPDEEMDILSEYCEMVDRTQTDVVRSHIRALESKLGRYRVTASSVEPYLLPSVPADKWVMASPVSCVYFVMADEVIVYIGRTENLKERWISNHHKREQILSRYPSARLHWLERGKKATVRFERDCIHRFKPPLNDCWPK